MKRGIILFFASMFCFMALIKAQPTLTISPVSNVGVYKAQLNANISNFGGWTVNGKGFLVSKSQNFADAIKITSVSGTANANSKLGDFYYLPGNSPSNSKPYFEPGTTYYVKAFAKKGSGATADTVFTDVVSFTTLAAQGGTCAVDSVTQITYTSARIHSKTLSVGDAYKIAKAGVVVGMTPNPTVSNATIATSTTSMSSLPKAYTVDVSGLYQGVTYYARAWIANQYTSTYYDTTYSEQITFMTLCAVDSIPYNVTFDSIGINSAKVSWTPRTGQFLFEVDYGFAGHTAGSGTIISCQGNSVNLTDLEGGRSYSVFVRAKCESTGDVGEWSDIRAFTTKPSLCANISSIHVEDLTHSFAKIEWTPGSVSQSVWEVSFAKANESYPNTPFVVYSDPLYSPIGLTPSTQYKVRVRAVCDPYYSDWTDDFTFTTLVMSLDEINTNDKVSIYPNPTNGVLKFNANNLQIISLDVYNSFGVKVLELKELPQELKINDSGVYFIIINTDKGIQTEKIIVK